MLSIQQYLYEEYGLSDTNLCSYQGSWGKIYKKDQKIIKVSKTNKSLLQESKNLQMLPINKSFPIYYSYEKYESYEILVMSYVPGVQLGDKWKKFSQSQKDKVISSCKTLLNLIHATPVEIAYNYKYSELLVERLGKLDLGKEQREQYQELLNEYKNEDVAGYVYCHGDFWFQNILIDDDMSIGIVDFGSSGLGPSDIDILCLKHSLYRAKKEKQIDEQEWTEMMLTKLIN